MKVELNKIVEAFSLHPRTVLRTLLDDKNAYWTEGYDPYVYTEDMAEVFECTDLDVKRALDDRDKFFKPQEAANFLKISLKTLYNRKYPTIIHIGRIKRFSRFYIKNYDLEHFPENPLKMYERVKETGKGNWELVADSLYEKLYRSKPKKK